MMDVKTVFKRYELKYLLDEEAFGQVLPVLNMHMVPDTYAHSSIRNVYLDTNDDLLVRRSIEKPLYKEKLRFRSYGEPDGGSKIFVELKKKYDSVVYKRRLTMPLHEAVDWFSQEDYSFPDCQIGREIDFLKKRYPSISPSMLVCYERDSYRSLDGTDLRITIDSDIIARREDVRLDSDVDGYSVLPDGYRLMEIKTLYGYPSWLNEVLNANRLYKTSFSKYGNAYKQQVLGSHYGSIGGTLIPAEAQ